MHESRKNKLTFSQLTRSTYGTPLVSKADADRELVESFRAKQQRMLRSPSGSILPAKASTIPPSQPAKPELTSPSQQPRMTSNGLPIYNYPPGKKHLSARDIENMRLNRYSPPVQESEELRQPPQSFSHPQKPPYSPTQEAFRFRQAMTKKRNYISARDRENMPAPTPFPSQPLRKNGSVAPHPNAPLQYHYDQNWQDPRFTNYSLKHSYQNEPFLTKSPPEEKINLLKYIRTDDGDASNILGIYQPPKVCNLGERKKHIIRFATLETTNTVLIDGFSGDELSITTVTFNGKEDGKPTTMSFTNERLTDAKTGKSEIRREEVPPSPMGYLLDYDLDQRDNKSIWIFRRRSI